MEALPEVEHGLAARRGRYWTSSYRYTVAIPLADGYGNIDGVTHCEAAAGRAIRKLPKSVKILMKVRETLFDKGQLRLTIYQSEGRSMIARL